MSMAAFQSAMLQLIVDPGFRDAVRAGRGCTAHLTPRDAVRLRLIADDPGLDINRTLHKGFRMGKLRTLLPLTCTLLGPTRLAREVTAFWQRQPPAGFSFLPEALAFIAFVRTRRLRYLDQVLAYEQATLELERARTDAPPAQRVAFEHDPAVLLTTLARGRRPRGVPRKPCIAVGARDATGSVQWALVQAPHAAPLAQAHRQTSMQFRPRAP